MITIKQARRALRSVALLLVLLAGGALLVVMAGSWALSNYYDDLPWYRLRPYWTSWEVVSIDGEPVEAGPPPTVTFGDATESPKVFDRIVVWTACGQVRLATRTDSDSDWIEFHDLGDPRSVCPASTAADHERLIAALLAVDGWSLQSDNEVTMHGGHEIRLRRVRSV